MVSLGRELLGGNGILADFLVAKVCGSDLVGVASFPPTTNELLGH